MPIMPLPQLNDASNSQQLASGNFVSGATMARDRRARAANRRSTDAAIVKPALNKTSSVKVLHCLTCTIML